MAAHPHETPLPVHLVYDTLGIVSYLHRTFPLAREATVRGHRFTFVTAEPDAAARIEEQGFDVAFLSKQHAAWAATVPEPHWPRAHRVLGRIPGMAAGPRSVALPWATARRAAMLDGHELLTTMQALAPDLVVTELEMHRDIRLLIGANWPVATIDDHYGTVPGPDAPHAGSAAIPTGTLWSRLRSRLGWERLLVSTRIRQHAERWWLDGNDERSVLDELEAGAGVAPGSIGHRSYMFHTYRDCPTIRPLAPELFFPGDDRSGIVTGPVVDLDRHTDGADPSFPERWTQLQVGRGPGQRGRLVYLALGSLLEGQTEVVERAVEAIAARPGVQLIMSLGRDHDRWAERSLPANVHAFSWVPQLEVLRGVDAMISRGGVASVHEALWFGVPQLFISGGGIGQAGLIARVVAGGGALRLAPGAATSAEIGAALDRILSDDGIRTRARALSAAVRAGQGVKRTVDVMVDLARRSPAARPSDRA